MSRSRGMWWVGVILVFAGCTSAANEASTTVAEVVEDLSDELAGAEATIAELEETVSSLESQIGDLEAELSTSQSERSTIESLLAEATAEVEALVLEYDAEIQAAIAESQQALIVAACERITGAETDTNISTIVAEEVSSWASRPGLPEGAADQVDQAAVRAAVSACRDTAATEAEVEVLTSPKDSGFYTVGTEIAAGVWESTGSGDGCYWARLDSDQEIIDNHFGDAGGRITIRASDAEVELSDCGTWEYQG